jgi:hypothetical protein
MLSRVLTRSGVSIPAHQHAGDYAPAKTEVVIIPSANTPVWGSMFTIDYKEKGVTVHNLALQFNLSAITVMTSGMYVPAQCFVDHIDYVMNGTIIDTYYPNDQFLQAQLFERDEDRALLNTAAGLYSSTSQRTTLAASASSYYLPLRDFFRQAKVITLLEQAHDLQLKVFLQPLASVTSGTGTATASINSVNLLARITRHRDSEVDSMKRAIALNPQTYRSVTVGSGVSNMNIVLSTITGPVSYLIFVMRPSASLTGNSAFAYTVISSYELLNSSGHNIVGGQPISNSMALLVIGNDNCRSSYLAETALGATNNNANVYVYSFSADAADSAENALLMGVHNFSGSEQLKITFTGSLGAAVQVDVYAYTEAVLSLGKLSVKKGIYKH